MHCDRISGTYILTTYSPPYFTPSALYPHEGGGMWLRCSLLCSVCQVQIPFWYKRAPKFLEGLIHGCEQFPWELLPYLLILLYLDEEGLVGRSFYEDSSYGSLGKTILCLSRELQKVNFHNHFQFLSPLTLENPQQFALVHLWDMLLTNRDLPDLHFPYRNI